MFERAFIVRTFAVLAFSFSLFAATSFAQKNNEQWLRTITEEGFVVDVSRWSLSFPQNNVISAKFKTTVKKQERVPEKTDLKYQTRLDLIEFNIKTRQYRIVESTYIDAAEKLVFSSMANSNSWKSIGSRTGSKFFSAATQLSPFGYWKVISYHYASGDPPSSNDPSELTSLVGRSIRLESYYLTVGKETCNAPLFEPKTISNEEFKKMTDSQFSTFGITTNKVEALVLKCESSSKSSIQTFVLRRTDEKALMLWEGVFLEMERLGNPFRP